MYAGGVGAIISLALGLLTLVGKLTGEIPVQGYTTLVIVICFFQLIDIILKYTCQYIWRIFDNTKKRQLYVIDKDFSSKI